MIDTESAVRGHVAAFNHGDLDALMAGFTDDAVWVTGTTVVRGRDQLAEFFGAAMTGLTPTLTVRELLADGERVACELTETLAVDGEQRTYAIAGFYRLRGGRIATATIYREGSAEIG